MADTPRDVASIAPESPLGIPIFRSVWLASMCSNFGGLVQAVGAAWLMTSLSDSPQYVALVQASVALPIMLFSLLAGAMADSFDRRKIMLGAQGFMFTTSIALTICAWQGLLTPWLLLGFTFLIGCGTAFNNPAWQASVGDMVPRATLPSAVTLNSMGFNIARSLGPAIGGAIVAAAGAAAIFLINAVSYVALIIVLARWRPQITVRYLPRERVSIAMATGLRYVAMSPKIRVLLLRAAMFGLAASAVPALMPLVARDLVAGGPLVYGVLLGAFGMGAVLGALASGRLRRRLSSEWILRASAIGLATGAAVTATSPTLVATLPALLLAGAGWVLALSTFNVTVQLSVPRWVVARALSLYQMSVFGGMAAGSWAFGHGAELAGVSIALLAAAMVQILGAILGLILPLAQFENRGLDPQDSWREPKTAVPVESRTGPVVITIERRIAEADIPAFLSVMSERRRISRRDGARRWTLLRDLGDPELWIERYHVPTWLDYVRNNRRRTHDDMENSEKLRALLLDKEVPRVHRMIERQTSSPPSARAPTPRDLADPMTDPTRAS